MILQSNRTSLCIYHGNCADGFGAAWVVRKWAKECGLGMEFYGAKYQTPPPDVTGKNVYIVDFSYKKPVLKEMAKKADYITIIDHHKTAAEDLQEGQLPPNVKVIFDMNHSGAMLTWLNFFNLVQPPQLLEHIEDRDLWRFKLEGTREIQAALFSFPYDFDKWDDLMLADVNHLRLDGVAIERKHFKDIEELLKVGMQWGYIKDHKIPVCNLPYTMASDAAHIMAKRYAPLEFAACYMDTQEGKVFSLRSTDEGLDVSAIAKVFGGGGHARAAGFTVSHGTRFYMEPFKSPL